MGQTIPSALSARRVEILLFVLLWTTYAYFYQSSQHNEAARFDQTRAILTDGVLHIDKYRYNTADVVTIARPGGPPHTYPNKAPGTSLLALPSFWLWMHVLNGFHLQEWVYWHLVAYLTTLTTVALLSALAALAMFAMLKRITEDAVFSALTVAAIWLGTICFPFSTLFFSHQQAAAQLVLAFWLLRKLRWDGQIGQVGQVRHVRQVRQVRQVQQARQPALRAGLAGLLCGFTLATEYPTILLVALLCVYFGVTLYGFRAARRLWLTLAGLFGAGLMIGVAILIAYNMAISGKIFFTPYEAYAGAGTTSPFPGHRAGYVGIHWPGWQNFWSVLKEITVRPQRGLLYIGMSSWRIYACNPVLWLALPGLVWLFFRKSFRLEAALVAAMAVVYLAFNACYGDSIVYWGGAWSVGPRHLIPLLPFLALPLVEGARRLWYLFFPLLLLSIFYMLLATAVEPRVPYEYHNPARDLFADKYLRGHLALNRLGLFDLQQRPLTANSTAFNLGKIAGLPGPLQLAPLMLLWLVFGSALIWAAWAKQSAVSSQDSALSTEPSAVSDQQFAADDRQSAVATQWYADGDQVAAVEGGKKTVGKLEAAIGELNTWEAVFRPRFAPWAASAIWAVFVAAIAAAPPLYDVHLRRALATRGGLLGKYYPNMQWQGPPAFVRKDPRLDFDWTVDPPLAGQFSAEWLGTIRIDRPGRYLFAVESDDGSFLSIGGKTIVSNGGTHPRRKVGGRLEITRAGLYLLAIRYFNDQYGGMVRVTWQPPGEVEQLLPSDVLSPPEAGGGTR